MRLGPDWAGWLDRLPALATALLDGVGAGRRTARRRTASCSLVLPVRTRDGGDRRS